MFLWIFFVKKPDTSTTWYTKYRPLIQQRLRHRKDKEFKEADEIRDNLLKEGITIEKDGEDTYCIWGPTGKWEKESTWL